MDFYAVSADIFSGELIAALSDLGVASRIKGLRGDTLVRLTNHPDRAKPMIWKARPHRRRNTFRSV